MPNSVGGLVVGTGGAAGVLTWGALIVRLAYGFGMTLRPLVPPAVYRGAMVTPAAFVAVGGGAIGFGTDGAARITIFCGGTVDAAAGFTGGFLTTDGFFADATLLVGLSFT